ncbi:MAG: hypothetical protein E6Q57_01215 [Mycobacterium sp.]|nr:MAG: hypothetical protein E6Q57_01215 [Mycobacterium sp.]
MRRSAAILFAAVLALVGSVLVAPAALAIGVQNTYFSHGPSRFMDTRAGFPTVDGLGPKGAITGPGQVNLTIAGRDGLPVAGPQIGSVALNVTIVSPSGPGWATVWEAGAPRPTASNLNYVAGANVPNMVIAKLGTGGQVSIYVSQSTTHVLVDVLGYFPATGDYRGLIPARLADTRPGFPTVDGNGPKGALVGPQSIDVDTYTRGGIPAAGVGSVVLNVTAVGATGPGHVRVWPTGSPMPTASTLNYPGGTNVPNLVIAKLGSLGRVSLYASAGTVNLIVDVMGYLPENKDYAALSPARIMDTRPGFPTVDGQGPKGLVIPPGHTDVGVFNRGGIPIGSGPIAVNVTVTNPSADGHLTVWGEGQWVPNSSNLNYRAGQTVANMVIVDPANFPEKLSVYNSSGSVNVIIDVMGSFPPGGPPLQVKKIAAGGTNANSHSCTITPSGGVKCWGANNRGQLGTNNYTNSTTPVDVVGVISASAVVAGAEHTCMLTTYYSVTCWGNNDDGQLGDGTTTTRPLPTTVIGISGVRAIEAGDYHTCATLLSGRMMCWGRNDRGQLGDGTTTSQSRPVTVVGVTGAQLMAAGNSHTCAEANGHVACWGDNSFGQLGDNTTLMRVRPVVSGWGYGGILSPYSLTAAGWHTCVASAGGGDCWGRNLAGELGDGTTTDRHWPTSLPSEADSPSPEASGYVHTCGTSLAGLKCWGFNGAGAVGDGTAVDRHTPTLVSGPISPTEVAGGANHTCAILPDTHIKCWGLNNTGQLGDGTTTNKYVPTAVSGL